MFFERYVLLFDILWSPTRKLLSIFDAVKMQNRLSFSRLTFLTRLPGAKAATCTHSSRLRRTTTRGTAARPPTRSASSRWRQRSSSQCNVSLDFCDYYRKKLKLKLITCSWCMFTSGVFSLLVTLSLYLHGPRGWYNINIQYNKWPESNVAEG